MDRLKNPYAPTAGRRPPELAGRSDLLERTAIDIARVLKGRSTKGLILTGLRGVGKTVLINEIRKQASDKGFKTIKIEAPGDRSLPALLAPKLRTVLLELNAFKSAGQKIAQASVLLQNFSSIFKINIGPIEFGVNPAPGYADSGYIEQDLPPLLIGIAEAAAERKTAVALLIDEVQYLTSEELAAIVASCHEATQLELPLFFVGAGLPQIPALFGNAKSYAERLFDYQHIDYLDSAAAHDALVLPAERENVSFTDNAVSEILTNTECYPYFIQEWGSHVWNVADSSPVTIQHVEKSTHGIIKHLDETFFRVRFDRLTRLEQKYLRAMAEIGPGPHKTGDIAGTLGVSTASTGQTRSELIKKGMVWSQRYGETAFTVPMFHSFMKRKMPKFERHVPRKRSRRK